jgi:hypothetical protein
MMEYRLVARVQEAGLNWPDELLDALDSDTGLAWARDRAREKRETGPAQGGLGEIILSAAVGAVADSAFKALLEQAQEALDRIRKRHLNPPAATVELEPVERAEPAEEADGEG